MYTFASAGVSVVVEPRAAAQPTVVVIRSTSSCRRCRSPPCRSCRRRRRRRCRGRRCPLRGWSRRPEPVPVDGGVPLSTFPLLLFVQRALLLLAFGLVLAAEAARRVDASPPAAARLRPDRALVDVCAARKQVPVTMATVPSSTASLLRVT